VVFQLVESDSTDQPLANNVYLVIVHTTFNINRYAVMCIHDFLNK